MMYFLIFFILFICANPEIQNLFANMIGKQSSDSVSGSLLALFACLLVVLVHNTTKSSSAEPFLFQVSKFNPRCNGLYRGKPSTFQYDQIGCNYNKPVGGNPDMITSNDKSIKGYCTPELNPPLGYIANDKDPMYGGDPHLFQNYGDTI